jgi:hypothetical protein
LSKPYSKNEPKSAALFIFNPLITDLTNSKLQVSISKFLKQVGTTSGQSLIAVPYSMRSPLKRIDAPSDSLMIMAPFTADKSSMVPLATSEYSSLKEESHPFWAR